MPLNHSHDIVADYMAGRYRASLFPYVSPFSFFHEMTTAEFSPLIELDPSNGLSTYLRDTIDATGDGSVTESGGELLVSSGATAGSTATLRTKERGRYQSGIEGLGGQEVRYPVDPTGDHQLWWEYGDGIDGARVGHHGTDGKFVQFIHSGTVDDRIPQSEWNMDTLDGSGNSRNPSGIELSGRDTTIWRTRFAHYGVGPAAIEAFLFDANGGIQLVPVHYFRNVENEIFWSNPKLPLRQHVDNGTTGGNLELYVGGRQFAVKGRYAPNRRQTPAWSDDKSVGTGSWTPLASYSKKADRKWRARSIKVSGLGVLTTEDVDIAIILGGTLTGAVWVDPPSVEPLETAMQFDQSATAISGGTAIDGTIGKGGQGSRSDLAGIRALGVDIPDDTVVTLAARGRSATSTCGAVFTMEEEA